MAHEWHKGILTSSSWHGLETVGVIPDAASMIHKGEALGAWPQRLEKLPVRALLENGETLTSRADKAVIAHYAQHPSAIVGTVGKRYRELAVTEWRELVRAACAAGARPTGAFALAGGSKVLGTFEIDSGNAGKSGVSTQLLLCDSFDGSAKLTAGTTSIRVVCANTLAAAMRADGAGMAQLRHTASLEDRIPALCAAIESAIATGAKVRGLLDQAAQTPVPKADALALIDELWPEAPETASPRARTIADNERREARAAMRLDINNEGPVLSTLWNAATYLVDRSADGRARQTRGGDRLESMLFGSRNQRLEEIQTIIEVYMRDGSIVAMPAREAAEAGVDPRQVGRAVIADLLGEALS